MRKESTTYESNMRVTGTYSGTEILPFDKIFELTGDNPIDIALESANALIQITLIRFNASKGDTGHTVRVIGQASVKFIEHEPEE